MSEPSISWVQLLTLMVHGPDSEPTVRGVITSIGGDHHVGWARLENEPDPVFAGAGLSPGERGETSLRVWRDGNRVRICEADGNPSLIVGNEHCWQFGASVEVPIRSPAAAVRYLFGGTGLLFRRDANDFAGDDFTRPAGPVTATTFLGRPAWTVEVAPPPHKPYPLRLTIDAETGLILQKRNDGFGLVEEWTEFHLGEQLPAELFSWEGPTMSAAQLRAAQLAEHEADGRRRSEWFAANVAPLPLRLELACGVWVHEYEPETGAFQASLGGQHVGMLARRPVGEQGSWQLGWSDPGHRWRDERWEWAVNLYDDDLTEEGLAALKRQLGSG
jgi:hypothetical protein